MSDFEKYMSIVDDVAQNLQAAGKLRMDIADAKQSGYEYLVTLLQRREDIPDMEKPEGYIWVSVRGALFRADQKEWTHGITGTGKNRIQVESSDFVHEEGEDEDLLEYDNTKQDLYDVEEKTPLDFAEEAELLEIIDELLSHDEKQVVQLLYFEDYSVREAGAVLGKAHSTVHNIQDRALSKLQVRYNISV